MLAILNEIYSTCDGANERELADSPIIKMTVNEGAAENMRCIEDVITFFAMNGSQTSIKFVYCKMNPLNPYDLQVLPSRLENPSSPPYAIVTTSGIISVSTKGTCSFTSFPRFLQDTGSFKLLNALPFFAHFPVRKIISRFQRAVTKRRQDRTKRCSNNR